MVLADAGHRCAGTVSSTGGMRTYLGASAPSTWENMACVAEWTRTDWGVDHVLTSWSWMSGKIAQTFSCLLDGGWTWSTRNLVCSWPAPLEHSKRAPAPGPPCSWPLSSSWRSEGPSLSERSRSDSAHSSFSEAEMDMESSSPSWPEETKSAMDGNNHRRR